MITKQGFRMLRAGLFHVDRGFIDVRLAQEMIEYLEGQILDGQNRFESAGHEAAEGRAGE